MGEVSKGEGRTVLFVSHNISSIQALCNVGIMLQYGAIKKVGNIEDVLETYARSNSSTTVTKLSDRVDRRGNGSARFTSYQLQDIQNNRLETFKVGQTCKVLLEIDFNTYTPIVHFQVALALFDNYDRRVANFSSDYSNEFNSSNLKQGKNIIELTIPKFPIVEGNYNVNLFCKVNGEESDWIEKAFVLTIENGLFFENGKLPPANHVSVLVPHEFIVAC